MTLRLAVLLSGGGTTLANLADRIAADGIAAEIAVCVSSSTSAGGIEKARARGIPVRTVPWNRRTGDRSGDLTAVLDDVRPDLVCMAGFLRLWRFPDRYAERVVNIHPALLPAFGGRGMYGMRVHRAVVAAGVKVSGCTVHFATPDEYDEGAIVLQRTVPVAFDDSAEDVRRRVFEAECEAYPAAVRAFAEGRVSVEGGRVRVAAP